MQPIYIASHSRPVRKVQYNYDGDLLFSCSDDGIVCMFRTEDCSRIGVFNVKEAVKSIDITKDSQYLLATATTKGVKIFSVFDGKSVQSLKVPEEHLTVTCQMKQVELNLGDTQFLVLYDQKKQSHICIYDLKKVIDGNTKAEKSIVGPSDHQITQATWGPLNKGLYYSTDIGKMVYYDFEAEKETVSADVHKGEIFQFTVTYDHTMLITCSKDGFAKLLNPRNFQVVREFQHGFPCRSASISPLFDSKDMQKFHVLLVGGQDAKEVTTTQAKEGGFVMRLMSIIFNQQLAEIGGHFGTVNTVSYSPDGTTFTSGSEDGYLHFHKFPLEYFTKKFE